MPIYTYECAVCENEVEAEKPMAQRKEAEACPKCGAACLLVISPVQGFVQGPAVPSGKKRKK